MFTHCQEERRAPRRSRLLAGLVGAALTFGLPLAGGAQAAVPVPVVEGPLPVTAESHPFGGAAFQRTPEDLSETGYVEEEFLVSGRANVYDWSATGPAVVRTPDASYTTRVLVRRPERRSQFSGNVVVEMLNPSNLFDLNIGWGLSGRHFQRNGDVWVGVTAKPISVEALKTFDPGRYGRLSFANPLPLEDPANCATVAADSQRTTENGLVWDIHSQVAAWLRSRDASNPLVYGRDRDQPLPVEKLYAFGYSQTGSFLYTYINAIDPLVVESNGRSLFDAFMIAVSSGPAPINQCAAPLSLGDPRRVINGAGVPVMRVMSQSDYLSGSFNAARRPDSDTYPDQYRNYELAGVGHATPAELYSAAAPADIEKAGRAVPPMDCNEGPRSRFPSSTGFNAMFQNLDRWVREDVAPPRADPIVVRRGQPVTDEFGNVLGGVRHPWIDVPTSTWFGNATGASFCRIAGWERPFSPDRLRQLYPDHAAYVRAFDDRLDELVRQRFVTRADAAELLREAQAADIP